MTNSTICCRFLQHKGAYNRKDKNNALWEHTLRHHIANDMNFKDIDFTILKYCINNKQTAIYESHYITCLKPKINRKFELSTYDII